MGKEAFFTGTDLLYFVLATMCTFLLSYDVNLREPKIWTQGHFLSEGFSQYSSTPVWLNPDGSGRRYLRKGLCRSFLQPSVRLSLFSVFEV
jgi:hypothetical protein